jgi:hypothetical protein
MHKDPPATRPIVNTINTPTYFASKYLHSILAPVMKAGKTYLQNSDSLLTTLENLSIPSTVTLLAADVKDLYPSIPIIEGLQALKYKLATQMCWERSEIEFILRLAEFVLSNNIFEYDNQLYIQIFGTAMGTNFAVVYANIYLDVLETEIWRKFTRQLNYNSSRYPLLIRRYIDDLFAIFLSLQDATLYVKLYNEARESIKLIPIYGDDVTVLDLQIYKGVRHNTENKLDIKLYQKEMNKYLYIPPDSFHRPSTLRSFISNEIKRYRKCCVHDEDFLNSKRLFYNRLIDRNHCPQFLQPLFEINYDRSSLLASIITNSSSAETSNKTKVMPTVFKILNTPRFKHSDLKGLLAVPDDLLHHPAFETLFNGRQPLVCYKRSNNIREILVKKKVKHS